MKRRLRTVDVFAERPLGGNPVAVVLDAESLDTDEMLAFTQWTNLSEATFVLPPTSDDADYRVRIFTLEREMPFAGHPTLGTAHAWLEAGGATRTEGVVVQECGAGMVPIRTDGDVLAFEAPPLVRDEPVSQHDLDRVIAALGLTHDDIVDAQWLDNGPGWLVVELADAEAVLAVEPGAVDGRLDVGLFGMHPANERDHSLIEVRAIFTDHSGSLREDPVTGSLNAAIAQALFRTDRASGTYRATQGRRVGRDGRIHLRQIDGATWVGGNTTTVVSGDVEL